MANSVQSQSHSVDSLTFFSVFSPNYGSIFESKPKEPSLPEVVFQTQICTEKQSNRIKVAS